jgi:uncharacterized protein YacL (UPF0231 family)
VLLSLVGFCLKNKILRRFHFRPIQISITAQGMSNFTDKQRAALEERHPDEIEDDFIHPDEIKPVEQPKQQEIQKQNLIEEEPEEYVNNEYDEEYYDSEEDDDYYFYDEEDVTATGIILFYRVVANFKSFLSFETINFLVLQWYLLNNKFLARAGPIHSFSQAI